MEKRKFARHTKKDSKKEKIPLSPIEKKVTSKKCHRRRDIR